MSATGELIAALIAGGMEAAEAAGLVARAAVEMTGVVTKRSAGAARQQRYRERHQASPSVTSLRPDVASPSVTNRNESVTSNADHISKEDKKDKTKKVSRATQLPDGWRPDDKRWQAAIVALGGEDRAERELRKFKNHALSKGRVAKNWGAAWDGWVDNALEWGNGKSTSDHRTDPAAGRATARETQHVAVMGGAALRYLQEGKSAGPGRDLSDDPDIAGSADPVKGTENAH